MALAAAGRATPTETPQVPNRPVDVVSPLPADSYSVVRGFTGRIEARRSADLGFQLAGELTEVAVADGAKVEAGQVLARLDTRRLDVRQRRLTAQLAQARARLDEMRQGPRPQAIAAAQARVTEGDEQLALLRRQQERRTALRASDVISKEALDVAASNERTQAARLESARRDLELLRIGTRDEQLRAQEAVLAQLEADLAAVAIDLEDSTLRAPFAGLVARVRSDEGTVVAAGQPILRVVEVSDLEAWVGIPPAISAGLSVGDALALRTRSGSAAGTVRSILPELDPKTRTTTVIVTVNEGPTIGLVPEQVVHVEVEQTMPSPGAYWIPQTALDRGERELWSVYAVVARGGVPVVERRDVEVLRVATDRVLVRGGLTAADIVVASGVDRLVPAEPVAVARAVVETPQ